jgi:hypothetical protein
MKLSGLLISRRSRMPFMAFGEDPFAFRVIVKRGSKKYKKICLILILDRRKV